MESNRSVLYDAGIDAPEPHQPPEQPVGTRGIEPLAGVLVAIIAAAFVLHARAWSFTCDDAFISFRYAEHLGTYGQPVFNVGVDPPEFVEGYTNFGWVLLLAGGSALGIRPHLSAPALTGLASLAGLVLAVMLVRALSNGAPRARLRAFDLVPAMVLVAQPEYMVWSGSGLETAMSAALVLGAMVAWVRGRWTLAALVAAAAGLTRPDALLPIAGFGATWLLLRTGPVLVSERTRVLARVPLRRLAVATAAFVVPVLGHLLWRRAYYGAWVPNTWPIKAHGMLLRDTYGIAYLQSWFEHVHWLWLSPLVVALRPRHAVLVAPIGAVVGYGWWVGGDFMAYSRFYVVATALLAVLVAWVLRDLFGWLGRRTHHGAVAMWGPLVVGALLAAGSGRDARARHAQDVERGGRWLDGKWEGVTAMDHFAKVGFAAGSWMRAHLPRDTWITVGAAGAVPYGAGLPTIDAYGLVDPVIATLPKAGPYRGKGARPGHQLQAPPEYIRSRDPDLLCHAGYRGPRRPASNRAHRAFRRGYTWACIDLPAIPDDRAAQGELPAGVYCCRRPTDRVVGPFGGAGGR